MKLNKSQLELLRAWRFLLVNYLAGEWRTCALGYGLGALSGTAAPQLWNVTLQWVLRDKHFTNYRSVLDGQAFNLWFILAPFALIVLAKVASIALRAARSWLCGIASGSFLWPFAATFISFGGSSGISLRRELIALALSLGSLLVGFALRVRGRVIRESTPGQPEKQIERPSRREFSGRDQESPIERWDEDQLGRSPLVETLALKILVSKTPVIALRGNFGDGKTSVLNLLRLHLGRNAIVVSFSSWLPDSQQTLVRDLFGDIAAEIERRFIVPGLRKRLHKFASLLGGTVPYLKSLPDLLSPYTQREELRDLAQLLNRIPKRVVVLLDEIDRMQKDEILTLLKVIRGVSTLPNLSFVCAFQQEEFETTVCGKCDASSNEFMEKFFPTAIDLPKPSPQTLERTFRDRVIGSLEMVEWFTGDDDRDSFTKRLGEVWGKAFFLVCTNIRKIGLVANDLHAAALLVRREVDPLDLCTLQVVRRFYPRAHELIWESPSFFCRSAKWWKTYSSWPEKAAAAQAQKIAAAVKVISEEADTGPAIYPLLAAMFPRREDEIVEGLISKRSSDDFSTEDEKGKRIAHPDFFPTYFHREVPQTVFSVLEMDKLIKELELANSDADRRSVFRSCFRSLESNSLRRYDFIHKVGFKMEKLPIRIATSVAFEICSNAAFLGDAEISESRRAVAAVLQVAQCLSKSEDINGFVSDCITAAGTDTFAESLYASMTDGRSNNKVVQNFDHVHELEITSAFAARMERQYGPDANISTIDLSKLKSNPFWRWASIGEPQRDIEISFWMRYVGSSSRRLAEAFNILVPGGAYWSKEAPDWVDRMIPAATLRCMYEEAISDEVLDPAHKAALDRLKRYLAGDLRYGEILRSRISPPGDSDEPPNGSPSD